MSALTPGDRLALRMVASVPCTTPGCPCETWRRDVADNLRLACPTVDDATLAHVALAVVANITRYTLTSNLTAIGAGGLLTGAALELAGAELEHPTD